MQKIYTGIDLGSDSIKMVTGEFLNQEFHVLGTVLVRSTGIRKGLIVDIEMASHSLMVAKQKMEEKLGIPITKAVVTVPSEKCEMSISSGTTTISREDGIVTGDDIRSSLQDSVLGQVAQDYELVTVNPINFVVDSNEPVRDPKNMRGSTLEVKAVLASVPKEYVHPIYAVLNSCEIEVSDICFASVGDYFTGKTKNTDSLIGAVINIGGDTTTVSVFNKGIMIKNSVLKVGGKYLDNDIRYVYDVDMKTARSLKENFAVSSRSNADYHEVTYVESKTSKELKVNQSQLSEVIEARLVEILRNAKKEINHLTNREIRYIMVTGGISELTGFDALVDSILGENATVIKIKTMGVRNNQYSSVIGILKYFDWKLDLRDQTYAMFQDRSIKDLTTPKKKSDGVVSKVFSHFFEN